MKYKLSHKGTIISLCILNLEESGSQGHTAPCWLHQSSPAPPVWSDIRLTQRSFLLVTWYEQYQVHLFLICSHGKKPLHFSRSAHFDGLSEKEESRAGVAGGQTPCCLHFVTKFIQVYQPWLGPMDWEEFAKNLTKTKESQSLTRRKPRKRLVRTQKLCGTVGVFKNGKPQFDHQFQSFSKQTLHIGWHWLATRIVVMLFSVAIP